MLAYMFFPAVALLLGAHTLRVAGAKAHFTRVYGATLVLIGLAMAGGLISAEIANAAPHDYASVASLH